LVSDSDSVPALASDSDFDSVSESESDEDSDSGIVCESEAASIDSKELSPSGCTKTSAGVSGSSPATVESRLALVEFGFSDKVVVYFIYIPSALNRIMRRLCVPFYEKEESLLSRSKLSNFSPGTLYSRATRPLPSGS
jgi:hypothetical protein